MPHSLPGASPSSPRGIGLDTAHGHHALNSPPRKELDAFWIRIDEVLTLCRLLGFEILGITPPVAAIMTTLAIILLSIAVRAGTVLLAAPPLPMPRGERAPMLAIPT